MWMWMWMWMLDVGCGQLRRHWIWDLDLDYVKSSVVDCAEDIRLCSLLISSIPPPIFSTTR